MIDVSDEDPVPIKELTGGNGVDYAWRRPFLSVRQAVDRSPFVASRACSVGTHRF